MTSRGRQVHALDILGSSRGRSATKLPPLAHGLQQRSHSGYQTLFAGTSFRGLQPAFSTIPVPRGLQPFFAALWTGRPHCVARMRHFRCKVRLFPVAVTTSPVAFGHSFFRTPDALAGRMGIRRVCFR